MTDSTKQILLNRKSDVRQQIKILQKEEKAIDAALQAFGVAMGADLSRTRRNYGEVTIKQLVREFLATQPQGAEAVKILSYINSKREKPLDRESLSPQLSRLKKEGFVTLKDNVWTWVSSAPGVTAPDDTDLQLSDLV